jgi:hypothetical protein
MSDKRYQRVRSLTKHIIANPHNVDDGTKAALKAVVMKYVHGVYDDPTRVLERLYFDDDLGLREAVAVVTKRQQERSRATGAFYPPDEDGYPLDEDTRTDDDDDDDIVGKARTEKGKPMESLTSILKDLGPVRLCEGICERQRAPCDEHELVAVLTKHVGDDRAFAKLYEAEESVRRACGIAKATEFSVFDIKPVVVGGADVNPNDPSAAVRAYEEIVRIGREKFPFLSADQQFARIFENKNYAALAAQAHQRPGPSVVHPMPHASPRASTAKSDPAPNVDTAYATLLVKAREYQAAHPGLTEAQCFERIYTDRGNVELAKRERQESAAR